MPSRKTTPRRTKAQGLTLAAYIYFSSGTFFEAEHFEEETSEAERAALWRRHRSEILRRYSEENQRRGPHYAGRRPDVFWRELEAAGHERQPVAPLTECRETPRLEGDLDFLTRVAPEALEPWELEALRELVEAGQTLADRGLYEYR